MTTNQTDQEKSAVASDVAQAKKGTTRASPGKIKASPGKK